MSSFLHFGDKVARVLDDAANRMRVLACLPDDPASLRDVAEHCKPTLPPSLRTVLTEQASAEERFLRGGCLDTVFVREAMKATNALLAPDAASVLERFVKSRSRASATASSTLTSLRQLVYLRMELSGDPQLVQDDRSLRIQARIDKAGSDVVAKAAVLEASRAAWAREEASIAEQIARVKAEIADVMTKGAENETVLRSYTEQQSSSLSSGHGMKAAELADLLARSQAEFLKMGEANEAAAANLRKRRNNSRGEYARVIADYDRDMGDVVDKISKVNAAMQKEAQQLSILQAHFLVVDRNNEIAAREAEAFAKKKDAERAARDAKCIPAARRIQRWYRAILEARAAEKKAKAKAAKGAKGKGKAKK